MRRAPTVMPLMAWWRCRRGAMAIEFGMVGPLMVVLVLATIEAGIQAGIGLLLDSAARDASRFGVTGAAAPPGMTDPPTDRAAAIRRVVLDRGAGLLADERLQIVITSFGRFEEVGQQGAGVAGPGARGEVVLYELTYTQPVLTGVPALVFGRSSFTHVATALVRNEPFPAQ